MKILVLHSGGMDSTTCLYAAHKSGAEVYSLGIDYGQRLSVELRYAQYHCDKLGIPREVIQVNWRKPERQIPLNRPIKDMSATVSPAFLPGRNTVFLSLGCAYASGIGADELHIGINSVEYSGYPDCTTEFLETFQTMSSIANPSGPSIVAPLMNKSKPEIAQMARNLGIGEHDTWSCYRPQITEAGIVPCRECDACRLHEHAWRMLD